MMPYVKGDSFKISGSGHYASVIHVDRFADEKICFSTIPLIYPEIARVREEGGEPTRVVMSAPQELNMEAELPLTPVPGSEIRDVAGLVR